MPFTCSRTWPQQARDSCWVSSSFLLSHFHPHGSKLCSTRLPTKQTSGPTSLFRYRLESFFALEQSSSKESAVLFGPFLFSSPWARARIPRPQLCCSCSCRGSRGLRVAQATVISVSAPSNSVGLCLPCSSLTPQSADLPTCLLSLAPFLVLLTPLTPLPLSVTSSRLWL